MDDFCRKNSVSTEQVSHILDRFEAFEALIDSQNDQYIKTQMVEQKNYLDSILKACDPKIRLDEDQRKVVLTDEDYCLVVAGAGAGNHGQRRFCHSGSKRCVGGCGGIGH